MKKITLLLILCATLAFSQMRQVAIDKNIVESGVKIVDIRIEGQLKEDGVLKNSIFIPFLEEDGSGAFDAFLKELEKSISKDEEFALLCRSGKRTNSLGAMLSQKGYKVINLQGGVKSLKTQGYIFEAYK